MKKHIIKKELGGAFLALALLTAAVPTTQVKSATLEELQAQIQALLIQLQSLQGNAKNATCPLFTSNPAHFPHSGTVLVNFGQFEHKLDKSEV